MEIRKIREEEKKQYYKMTEYAFESWRDKEAEDDKLGWMRADESLVLIDKGMMASSLVNSHMKQVVRGTVKKMSAIGNVASYPEYRNKGYIRMLFAAAFEDSMKYSLPVSALQPFKEGFYQKFGYVSTAREIVLNFHVSAIQHYLDHKPGKDWQVTRGSSAEMQKELLNFLAAESVNYNGLVIFDNLDNAQRRYHFRDSLIMLVKYKGEVMAGCKYTKKGMKITIGDVLWKNFEARKVFFQFFACHRDQVGDFAIPIPMSANFYNWFRDADKEYEIKMCDKPWMVRVIDLVSAFKDTKLTSTSPLSFNVSDEMCEWNNGMFRLESIAGKALMTQTGDQNADFDADIKAMAALLYGSMPVEEIIDRGWLKVNATEKLEQIKECFPIEPYFNFFWF